MAINKSDSRIVVKRSTVPGEVPTLPPSSDFTDGTWIATDVLPGELFLNIPDQRIWIGVTPYGSPPINPAIEFSLTTPTTADLATILANGNLTGATDIIISGGQVIRTNTGGGQIDLDSGFPSIILLSVDGGVSGDGLTIQAEGLKTNNTSVNTGADSFLCGYTLTNNVNNALVAGDTNLNNGNNSLVVGKSNTNSNTESIVYGKGNTNTFQGGIQGGNVGVYGSFGHVVAGVQTTNATITELLLDTTGTFRFVLATDTGYYVRLSALAADTATGDIKQFMGEGVIKNVGGTTSLISAITMSSTITDASMTTATMTVTADAGNNSLKIQGTGITATTINWVCNITYTKINH